jgi:hypothetical protein
MFLDICRARAIFDKKAPFRALFQLFFLLFLNLIMPMTDELIAISSFTTPPQTV